MKLASKQFYEKCLVVLICLLMFGNLAQGPVLCFGSDGRIEVESTLHERCDGHSHSKQTDQKQFPYQSDHTKDKNCEPCVDIPIFIGLAKISSVAKQLDSTFHAPSENVVVLDNSLNLSAYNSASSSFDAAPYFTPLRTVILLI